MNAQPRACAGNGWRSIHRALCAGLLPALWQPVVAQAAQAPADVVTDFPFDWQTDQGTGARLARWRGQTFFLTMAYSECRQVCSFTLHRLEEIQESADRAGTPIEVVVISYDPNVDGPGTWSNYRRHHRLIRTNWHFLTGTEASTEAIAGALQFPHWRYDEHIVHDFKILEIGADGRIARTFSWANRNDDPFSAAAVGCPSSDTQGCNP